MSGGHTNGQPNHQSFLGHLESQLEGFRRSDAQRDALVQVGQDLWLYHNTN
jgi:hypothetical protein